MTAVTDSPAHTQLETVVCEHALPEERSEPHGLTFQAIYESECSYVWKTLRRLGVHERDLEDVTHDVFVTVHRHLDRYDRERPLRPWLFGIAFRVASDYRRRAQHRREVVAVPMRDEVDREPLPDEILDRDRARELLLQALEAVKLDRRAVLVMHDVDGIAAPEIAEALAIPLNTVYSRLRLARGELAAAVRRLKRGAA
jgi:RNA polymerase sigma-70 factor, ECF subfamily